MKEANMKSYIMFNSNYMTFWEEKNKNKNKLEMVKRSVFARLWEEEGRKRSSIEDFLDSEIILYGTQWWIHVTTHLSKSTECTTTKGNSNVNYGFWVIKTCQYSFISYNRCSTLVEDFWQWGRIWLCGDRGYMGNLCIFCSILLWT